MKGKDPTNKKYPEQESSPFYVVTEPEVLYETKPEISFEEDFNRALATALTPEEFLQRMYKRIEAWQWKEQ
jgi:hypothetical protein